MVGRASLRTLPNPPSLDQLEGWADANARESDGAAAIADGERISLAYCLGSWIASVRQRALERKHAPLIGLAHPVASYNIPQPSV